MSKINTSPYINKIHKINSIHLNVLKILINQKYSNKSINSNNDEKIKKINPDEIFNTPQKKIKLKNKSKEHFNKKNRTINDIILSNQSKDVYFFILQIKEIARCINTLSERISKLECGPNTIKRQRSITTLDYIPTSIKFF